MPTPSTSQPLSQKNKSRRPFGLIAVYFLISFIGVQAYFWISVVWNEYLRTKALSQKLFTDPTYYLVTLSLTIILVLTFIFWKYKKLYFYWWLSLAPILIWVSYSAINKFIDWFYLGNGYRLKILTSEIPYWWLALAFVYLFGANLISRKHPTEQYRSAIITAKIIGAYVAMGVLFSYLTPLYGPVYTDELTFFTLSVIILYIITFLIGFFRKR